MVIFVRSHEQPLKIRVSHYQFQLFYIWDSELKFFNNRISQKDFEIYDFYDFEETFRSECSERNERSP